MLLELFGAKYHPSCQAYPSQGNKLVSSITNTSCTFLSARRDKDTQKHQRACVPWSVLAHTTSGSTINLSLTHTKSGDRDRNFCSYFFNVSQWAGNILDEIFSKEYIQLPSTINLTMTTKFLWQIFFSLKVPCGSVSLHVFWYSSRSALLQ